MGTLNERPRKAVLFAPFFSPESAADRPRAVAIALGRLMPIDLVTTDFDHLRKTSRTIGQCTPFQQTTCLAVTPYNTNVSIARLISHLLFAFKAGVYFWRRRDEYDVVCVTLPLNFLAWLVFSLAGTDKQLIVDVVDIWPDVLPFRPRAKRVLAPVFAVWKWFFKASVWRADTVIAVSDSFLSEASHFANRRAQLRRFYIGQRQLRSTFLKQPIFTVAYVGNFGHLYDFDTLLDVLSEPELGERMQLYLIGDGDRREWLLTELERRKIRHKYWGVVFEPGRLVEILSGCHVGFNGYVRTTASFSYKACTYLAAGLPLLNSMGGTSKNLSARTALERTTRAEIVNNSGRHCFACTGVIRRR